LKINDKKVVIFWFKFKTLLRVFEEVEVIYVEGNDKIDFGVFELSKFRMK
jgi:hypothetical protein